MPQGEKTSRRIGLTAFKLEYLVASNLEYSPSSGAFRNLGSALPGSIFNLFCGLALTQPGADGKTSGAAMDGGLWNKYFQDSICLGRKLAQKGFYQLETPFKKRKKNKKAHKKRLQFPLKLGHVLAFSTPFVSGET